MKEGRERDWTHLAQVRSVSQSSVARDCSMRAAWARARADGGLVLSRGVVVQARFGLAARHGEAVSVMGNVEGLH
jgi:hypothetical protein